MILKPVFLFVTENVMCIDFVRNQTISVILQSEMNRASM